MTLSSLIAQYLEWKGIGGASGHTVRAYERNLAKLLEALGQGAEHETLTAFSLQNFVGYLRLAGLSDNSIAQALAAAKSFVSWASNEGIYPDNFAEAVRGPRRPRMELLYGGGLRNSELVGLNVDDRLKEDELLVRGKGKKERKVPMSEPGHLALTNYLPTRKRVLTLHQKDTTALILNLRGGRITTRSVGRLVKQIALAKGLPRTTHTHLLRHACAGHMLEKGAHLSDVKTLLGHARLGTTLIYSGGTNWKRMRESYDRTGPSRDDPEPLSELLAIMAKCTPRQREYIKGRLEGKNKKRASLDAGFAFSIDSKKPHVRAALQFLAENTLRPDVVLGELDHQVWPAITRPRLQVDPERLYQVIDESIQVRRYAPTIAEMSKAVGRAGNAVKAALRQLESEGHIELHPWTRRITITKSVSKATPLTSALPSQPPLVSKPTALTVERAVDWKRIAKTFQGVAVGRITVSQIARYFRLRCVVAGKDTAEREANLLLGLRFPALFLERRTNLEKLSEFIDIPRARRGCKSCGAKFVKIRPNQCYCSARCRRREKRQRREATAHCKALKAQQNKRYRLKYVEGENERTRQWRLNHQHNIALNDQESKAAAA